MLHPNDRYDWSESQYNQMMESSARDWEIIRNKSFGTNDRVWSTDADYVTEPEKKA